MNDYAQQHPRAVRSEHRWVLPLTAVDVLAHLQRMLFLRFLFADGAAVEAYAASHGTPPHAARASSSQSGSNAYAIAPARSASGHSLLLINPHLPWSGELTLFEAQIVENARFMYGAALVGQPYISMGFNDALGWAHTMNGFDALDTYELTLCPGGYMLDGAAHAFETLPPVTLRVRKPNGKLEARQLPRLRSEHGPVVWLDEGSQRALSLRFSPGAFDQLVRHYWRQADARTLAEFEAAATRDRLATFDTLYADREGQILFRYEGVMPRRNQGDYLSWQGVQPGQSSANLWRDVFPQSASPRVHNPASGFLQNANDPPWFVTLPPLDARAYPAYIAPPHLDYRAEQSLRRVANDSSISFEELVTFKQSNRVELADRFLPALLTAAEGHAPLEPARRVLASWDHALGPDARGAVLFFAWIDTMEELGGPDWAKEPWSLREPLATPRGLADERIAITALDRASQRVKERYGSLAVTYGSVYRLRRGRYDLPASAGPVRYGVYSAAEFAVADGGRQVAWGGDSFVAVVEFSDPVHAMGLLAYGNASAQGSPFVGDQLILFSRRELRPLWIQRPEVEQHVHEREQLKASTRAHQPRPY
jgi:acyl-homoserine-lactone acylase